jgi:hypothetical protein
LTCSINAAGRLPFPFAEKTTLTGRCTKAWRIRAMCHGPGVQGVPTGPVVGPTPPPTKVGVLLASS